MLENPKEITTCSLQCILMPNGEVLCKGRTIGLFRNIKEYLVEQKGQKHGKDRTHDQPRRRKIVD